MRTMTTRTMSGPGWVLGVAVMLASQAEGGALTFDNADALQGLTVSGDVRVDPSQDHGGDAGGAAAGAVPAGPKKGGSLRVGPGGKAVWPLRAKDGTGVLELWVYEDGAKPANPKDYGAGALWGLMQADGHMAAVGAIYAPYLDGAATYAVATLNPAQQKPWQQVTYLGIRRAPGWHKWTFDFDPDKGLRLSYDDQEVKNFNWNQSQLRGFASVVLFGDATDARQALWVDDATVTLGPPVPPQWIVRDYEKIKAVDPTRPTFLGLGQGVAWEKWHGRGERSGHLEDYAKYLAGCDVACFDIYPAAHDHLAVKDALWYVPRGVRRLRAWCHDSKPVWVHLETGSIAAPGSQPTPSQVKAEVWMALIHGARGIDYFVHQFQPKFNEHALLDHPEMLAMVTAVNQQITALARVLNSATIGDGATVASTNPKTPVHALVKRQGGATYVFSAALYGEATQATFRVQGLTGNRTAEVLGEDRQVRVQNGVFTDAFAGYGVHLYRIAEE